MLESSTKEMRIDYMGGFKGYVLGECLRSLTQLIFSFLTRSKETDELFHDQT